VKSAVETLNPTRVRLTVAVPFEELKPSLDAAYRKIARQVNVPGFRKGKVPARIIDQRFGRAVVLEEAMNEALPQFYGQAVEANDVHVLGQPDVDVTEFADGQELRFTAEVDVRPELELPDYEGLHVTVEDADVTDDEIGVHLDGLRDRFATLTGVDRPAQLGDYLSIDLAGSKDGQEIEDARASGLSYEVGSDTLLDGLDDAVLGKAAGESATFTTKLHGGELSGEEIQVVVTVNSVKQKQPPELDDEFAQAASEFDTVDELRADIRSRLERQKKLQQLSQARDRTLETLLAKVEVPLPEGLVASETRLRRETIERQLLGAGLSLQEYLEHEGQSAEQFEADLQTRAREALTAQLVLDEVAKKEQLSVAEGELTQHLLQRAAGSGLSADDFAQQVVQSGRVPALVSEVVRGKALALVLEHAEVRDESGRDVDLAALRPEDADESEEAPPAPTANTR
jgi:trigger factor